MSDNLPPVRSLLRRFPTIDETSAYDVRRGVVAFLVVAGLLLGVTEARSEPGPVGPEYPVENRSLPPKRWWTMCTDASGVTTTIVSSCTSNDCLEEPGDLFLERRHSNGELLGERLQVNEEPAVVFSFRLACHRAGWIVTQWQDAATSCFLHRTFAPDRTTASAPGKTIENEDCRTRASVAVRVDGRFMAAWPAAKLDGGSVILARRFGADGIPLNEATTLSDAEVVRRYRPKIATDEDGNTLVAWSNYPESGQPAPVLGHFVDADGQPFGATFQINTYELGENSEPALFIEGGGVFEVVWSNPYQGGRVARRVSLEANGGEDTTTSTTLPSDPSDVPQFGPGRVIDSAPLYSFDTVPRQLAVGSPGTWLVAQRTTEYWRTTDDGVKWQGPARPPAEGYRDTIIGADGAGVLGAAHLPFGGTANRIYLSRSTDDGGSWSDQAVPLPEGGHISKSCVNCATIRTDVTGTASGTWIAAWTVHDFTAHDGKIDEDIERVYIVRSNDRGKSWSKPIKVAAEQGVGRWGFDLATDGDGTWVVIWIDADVRVSRSTDDGRTWSSPATIASAVTCHECGSQERYATVHLVGDGSGAWAAVFASASYLPATYGYDGDVFALRSNDNAATWSGPQPLDDLADRDATRDLDPTIAADAASGQWLSAWISHRPIGGGDDLDADVVMATSPHAGDGWNAPASLSARGDDNAIEAAPLLATDARGEMMLAWQSAKLEAASNGSPVRAMRAAIAGSRCGDGTVQTGEGCDDANLTDGDGCDSDCTPTGCGNGIVTEGEECDVGSNREAYDCLDCHLPVCGDGVVQGSEQCDDGNDDPTDGCEGCGLARCGDGVVNQAGEECDSYGSGCTSDCKLARCGDGEIQPFVEACDDGNTVNDDACPNDCSKATCGDGHTSRGFEECDYKDPVYAGECTPECILVGICGDSNGDALVTATDARLILQQAVGLDVGCPHDACDIDASGTITVKDAKMGLHKAVELPVGERCSIGTGNIVFWIDDPQPIGALQIDIEYAQTGGDFRGSADTVACELLMDVLASFNDNEANRTLSAGFIAIQGFWGHKDLFRCAFEMPEDRTGVRFFIRVVDAAGPDLTPIPGPQIGYRLE